MAVKTFMFDMRGFKSDTSYIDTEINAWIVAETPTTLDSISVSMGEESLIVIVSYTA